ncbi:hypothetical protein DOTSEDRAFT_71371 [Dothistroma septosporum NZE10]|uniref:DUF788 domain protein n=1 Tax=Dothistroma septosporum (strain NZE10 / CBS 128990) TaxID=675120 RepID=N1PQD4_DOTSN|nr:hypothetical protein DOTSEDRAFT_71371 [Dothistroma septosporum NZE10]
MAKKALKTLAQQNAATLNKTHAIAAGVNIAYLLLSLVIFRRRSLFRYILLNFPALVIEFWFERIGRPAFREDGSVKRPGEDLEAKGLTEWMWDVLYWTWGNLTLVALTGDWAWWLMLVPVAYSGYLAFTTYTGMRKGMGGMMGSQQDVSAEGAASGGQSKRQVKIEKRGGQRVQYR